MKLELEKRKVVCGAEVIKGVGYLFRLVTEGGWRGIGDTVHNVGSEGKDNRKDGLLKN